MHFIRPEGSAVRPCNLHIVKTLQLTEEMIRLADRGEADRSDNGCGILYGVLRDSAYKLRKLAEEEKRNHVRKGWWPKEEDDDAGRP
jgi:hypothetical protein